MSKDGYSGLDTVPFHWCSILNVMYGLYQKLFEGLSLHDKRFEGWWKRLGKNEIDQSADFFYSVLGQHISTWSLHREWEEEDCNNLRSGYHELALS